MFARVRRGDAVWLTGVTSSRARQLQKRPKPQPRTLAGHELECAGELVRLMLIAAVAVVVQPQASQSHPRIRMGPPEPYRSPSIACSETLSIRKSAAGAAVALVAT